MKWFGDTVLKAIQLPARYLFAVTLICVFFLVLPVTWTAWLRIEMVLGRARGWLVLIAAASFAFGVAQLIPALASWRTQRAHLREVLVALDTLSMEERVLLGYCVIRGKRTLLLDMGSAFANVAGGLSQKGLVEMAPGTYNICAWPHTIPDFVWSHIVKRKDAILEKN